MRRIPGGGRGQLAVGSVRHPVSRRGDGVVWNRPGVERVFGALAVSGGSPLRYLFPEDRKNRCLAPVVTRSSYGDYLSSQVLASGLGSASVVFLPLLLNLLLCYLAFPSNHNIKLASYQGNMYAAVLLGENRLYTSLGTTYFLLPFTFSARFVPNDVSDCAGAVQRVVWSGGDGTFLPLFPIENSAVPTPVCRVGDHALCQRDLDERCATFRSALISTHTFAIIWRRLRRGTVVPCILPEFAWDCFCSFLGCSAGQSVMRSDSCRGRFMMRRYVRRLFLPVPLVLLQRCLDISAGADPEAPEVMLLHAVAGRVTSGGVSAFVLTWECVAFLLLFLVLYGDFIAEQQRTGGGISFFPNPVPRPLVLPAGVLPRRLCVRVLRNLCGAARGDFRSSFRGSLRAPVLWDGPVPVADFFPHCIWLFRWV